jgi:hypothetical protein
VEMVLAVEMPQTWHGDSLDHLAEGRRHKKQCLRHPCLPEASPRQTCPGMGGRVHQESLLP